MPDLDQIKQGEEGARDRGGRFAKGRSGNPAGRPRGCRDHVNRAARLLLAGEGADRPELERVDGNSPAAAEAQDRGSPDAFSPKIMALMRGFADAPPPKFAKASFAELFA
jgi:hypothetical protein